MINLLIADNQILTREGLIAILSDYRNIHIIGSVSTLAELEQLLAGIRPEVIIMDIQHFSVSEILDIRSRYNVQILILSNRQHKNEILQAIEHGIKNYIFKECSTQEITDAIHATAKGEQFFCERTMQTLFGHKLPPKKVDGMPLLSYRETEIVQLIAEGMANKDIAEKLYLSVHTIKTHRKNIIKKLGFTFKHASELILLLSYLNDFFI